ncbi:Ribonuclease H domain [Sesbania bispinosa]|nr:Ribonuclease H domain [Sesbania bispinosa]
MEERRLDLNLKAIGDIHQPENEGFPLSTPQAAENIILNQQSLANLVADLKAQTRMEEAGRKGNTAGYAEMNQLGRDDALVTQAKLRRMLRKERGSPDALFNLEPPLKEEVLAMSYPTGYQSPSFRKFDGTGSAREHLMCFLDDLGVHRDNKGLRMKEFSKSISGRAFTWYVKLCPRSIQMWEELATEFCGKFLEEEDAIHIMDLGRVKQKTGESLIAFIKRYRDRALQCKETLPEADLVKVNRPQLSGEQYEDPSYCILHKTQYHNTLECWTVRRTFQRQLKAGKLLLPEEEEGGDYIADPFLTMEPKRLEGGSKGIDQGNPKQRRGAGRSECPTDKTSTITCHCHRVQGARSQGVRLLPQPIIVCRSQNRRGEDQACPGGQWVWCKHFTHPLVQNAEHTQAPDEIFRHNTKHLSWQASGDKGCIKSNFKGKEIEIPGVVDPFEASEAHLIDDSLFDEVAPPGSGSIIREQHGNGGLMGKLKAVSINHEVASVAEEQKQTDEAMTASVKDAPSELQDTPKQQEEELEEINIIEHPGKKRPLFIGKDLKESEKESLLRLLQEFRDVFAWDYDEMLGLSTTLVSHNLAVRPAQKHRHYFQTHTIEVISKSEGIKYMLHNPSLAGKMSKWALMLSEYDLRIVHPNKLKSQALVDMMALSPRGNEEEVIDEVRGEMPEVNACREEEKAWWILKFDRSPANPDGGAGVVLSNRNGEVFTFSYHIGFPCINNEAEYEALILGLRMPRDLGVKHLKIEGDSNLVIKQLKEEYGVKEASLAAYRDEALKLINSFEGIEATHIPRVKNRHADALATIGSKETTIEGEEIVLF